MFFLLKSKKIKSWCLFDFAISSYPTLIITFFYGAFYAKEIALTPEIGTSLWGFALSSASVISFLFLSFILINGGGFFKIIRTIFFKIFFYVLIFFTFGLVLFEKGSNQIIPLLFIIISLVCFEFVTLFYNVSLHKVKKGKHIGALSNLGWAFGYLGGLVSLLIVFLLIQFSVFHKLNLFDFSIFLLIGPFVAIWTLVFGYSHFENLKTERFRLPSIVELIKNLKSDGLICFLISYFFFNNAVISIFAFASMFAAFLFGLTESQILFLGIFINLFGIVGCLILGKFEDEIGSLKIIKLCILALLIFTTILFYTENIIIFWLLSLMIGFFVGPIQASSRSVLAKKINTRNQLSAFSLYSMFGNLCSILGPFFVGITIDFSGSIRLGLLTIPMFLFLSIFPFLFLRFRTNV